MALDAEAIGKPFKKLRKLLKDFPDSPAAEDVHDLRTHTRRIEAIVGAFQLQDRKAGKSLKKDLKPIRKTAGDVRDMDVLTDLAASVEPEGDTDCRLKLIQHLSARRSKLAMKLAKKIAANKHQVRMELKDCEAIAEEGVGSATSVRAKKKDRQKSREKAVRSMSSSLQIEEDMREWPRLNKDNLHPFRLKVKELRYTLQLGQKSDSKLIEVLGEAKDQIGLWHDWNELAAIAADVIDHGARCPVVTRIRARANEEFQRALDGANALRTRYLIGENGGGKKSLGKKRVASDLHPALLNANSRLAG
jgi:CHAD domain-containing protein